MAWVAFGVTLFLLLIRMGVMLYTYAATARALHLRQMLSWPLLLELYMPLVDLWFRLKALLRKKRFGVSRIGIQ